MFSRFNSIQTVFYILVLAGLVSQCRPEPKKHDKMKGDTPSAGIESSYFGPYPEGGQVMRYRLRNNAGMEVDILNYGGIITRWTAPDREGNYTDVVLGFDRLSPYLATHPYFGAVVGRYANRIAGAAFILDGVSYTLARNNAANHLHGGKKGFDKVLWEAQAQPGDSSQSLVLRYTSPDGEEGYPGTLQVQVTYTLTDAGALDIQYRATTDQPTVVNLTQHTYFNLSGDFSQDILDHELTLHASRYLPVDSGLIPLGELHPVAGTPFDFTQPKPIGKDIGADHRQLALGGGYDHCWVLNGAPGEYRQIATAQHPGSGRVLTVHTDEPGVQFYTGNFLDGSLSAKKGGTYGPRSGFCLETQHFPDSPNQSAFPTTRLDPGVVYKSRTTYTFTN